MHGTRSGKGLGAHATCRGSPVQAILGTGQADTEAAGRAAKLLAPAQPYVAGFDLSPGIVDLMAEGFIDCTKSINSPTLRVSTLMQLALYLRYGLLPSSLDAGAAFIDRSNLEAVRRLSYLAIR